MVQITLQPAAFGEVELPCDDTLSELTVRVVGGKRPVVFDIQTTHDGLVWSSPVAHARVNDAQPKVIKLPLPSQTRKLRALVQNAPEQTIHVEIQDFDDEPTGEDLKAD